MVIHKIAIWVAIIYGTFFEVSSKAPFIFILFAANNADEIFHGDVCLGSSYSDWPGGVDTTELGARPVFWGPSILVRRRS